MNLKRGLFRLWLAIALLWIAAGSWVLRHDLSADCENLFLRHEGLDGLKTELVCKALVNQRNFERGLDVNDRRDIGIKERWIDLVDVQWTAVQWLVLPPLLLFGLGVISLWVGCGFRLSKTK